MAGAAPGERADAVLVARGFFTTRAQAQAAIAAGRVTADGALVRKPAQRVKPNAAIVAEPAHPWASRGGLKLVAALDLFGVDPTGREALDVGASTGGFTDVLLARGAARVTAVDVGRDQLAARLRADPRVAIREGLDARALTPADLPSPPDLIVCDASFIGLAKVLSRPLALAAPGAVLVALFKPQFEVGPDGIGKGGLVRADADVAAAEARTSAWLEAQGWPVLGAADSPIIGGAGARERLLHARRGPNATFYSATSQSP